MTYTPPPSNLAIKTNLGFPGSPTPGLGGGLLKNQGGGGQPNFGGKEVPYSGCHSRGGTSDPSDVGP